MPQVLKTPRQSGQIAPSARFFYAHGLLLGRECDGYNTRKGKQSAHLCLGFQLPPAPAENGGPKSLTKEQAIMAQDPFTPVLGEPICVQAARIASLASAASYLLCGCTPANPLVTTNIVADLLDVAGYLAGHLADATEHLSN